MPVSAVATLCEPVIPAVGNDAVGAASTRTSPRAVTASLHADKIHERARPTYGYFMPGTLRGYFASDERFVGGHFCAL